METRLARLIGAAAVFAAALLCALVLAPQRAEAASNCSLSTAGIAFSPYDAQTKTAVDGAGTISVTCNGSGTDTLSLNITGGNTAVSSACTASRNMKSGANTLSYILYRDAARTQPFCDGTNRMDITLNFTTSPQTFIIPFYGRVSGNQNPVYAASGYSDTLTVTLKNGGNSLASTTMPVTGSVAANCTVSAGTLGFGSYSGSQVNATASVSVNCSNGAAYQVGMSGGSNLNGTTRRMAGPLSSFLTYQLYSNSLRTVAWGDGSALGARVSGTGSGAAQTLTVYGRIPAGQSPAAGSYSDSVVVTVEY